MDENEDCKSPIRRLGSTRKLLVFNNIRLQLNEQLRCLDVRMEAQVALLTELQDFFRRRGELELDYSKNLDKLAKSLQLRHKEQKQKREQWPLFSSYACWQQLVTQTKNLSRDHVALSEVYSTHLVSRLGQVMDDVQRIYKRCREIGYETHEEILRVLHELHTTMKTYHSYQSELRQTETKLRAAEVQRTKLEGTLSHDKLERSKKYKLMEKEVSKRRSKYTDAKIKALKARNEYILCLEASNTTIHKYFVDDLSDLIDCMDFGFHNCISRALLMHVTAEEGRQKSVQSGLDSLSSCINSLDSRLDKQRFLEYNHSAFMIPKKLEFQGQKTEEPAEPDIQGELHREMESRLSQLQQRVTSLRAESEEVWKTLETAETSLMEMLNAKDYDCSGYFGENAQLPLNKPPEALSIKARADKQETEEFYLTKFREYLLGSSKIARLDAKQEYLRQSLVTDAPELCQSIISCSSRPVTQIKTPKRKRIGRLQLSGQPKLFGGSLEEYQEATNQDIPLILRSCIRVINLYGLHHQGIFRVSGSQVEINNFREWFERGEDPLADMTDASDINSVAGVFKLYLRELREPLFPIIYFEQIMELAQLENKREFISKMREVVKSLPRPVMIVLRYLFAFLNHLSEFADENMMDPYNLAICFGPTLVPVPDDKDQVQYQNQVNELIKNIIIFHDEIFPNDDGPVYEKYISTNTQDDQDVGDSPSDQTQDDIDSEVCPSEDDSENLEATAQFDFIARSNRELSLKRGETVVLYSQVSNDWWRGAVNGQEGLVPDKYISLKIRDESERDVKVLTGSSSEESIRRRLRRASVSSNDLNRETHLNRSVVEHSEPAAALSWTSSEHISNSTNASGDLSQNIRLQKTLRDISKVSEPDNGTEKEKAEIDESNVNFNENRDLWQRRANSEAAAAAASSHHPQRHSAEVHRQSHTPDLVMDLPLSSSISVFSNLCFPEEAKSNTSQDVESPEMTTAAETFAKQNQNTLKKNTKIMLEDGEFMTITSPAVSRKYATLGSSTATTAAATLNSTSTFKPQPPPPPIAPKEKPLVLKKPAQFSVPLRTSASIEMVYKNELPS
ncbi:SLIT-ROBO Rho GTPase-activating protein 1-like isoform X2 [Anthonomus grandis grandis]|uniref:SLIT-ROBO Rho GTPase-activating protein 1-like isoform X2 n=1 Tax=Anthonomus grandis grandis TaxID=2921223 RepID=UPI0021655347|nr:SLIT-ROBO Rho GTPase-activating protein 1-like isoform X2 [Anthonomus grandis grandis]